MVPWNFVSISLNPDCHDWPQHLPWFFTSLKMRKWRELDNNHIVCHITAGILTTRSTSLGVRLADLSANRGASGIRCPSRCYGHQWPTGSGYAYSVFFSVVVVVWFWPPDVSCRHYANSNTSSGVRSQAAKEPYRTSKPSNSTLGRLQCKQICNFRTAQERTKIKNNLGYFLVLCFRSSTWNRQRREGCAVRSC